jgi:hypothetical protein
MLCNQRAGEPSELRDKGVCPAHQVRDGWGGALSGPKKGWSSERMGTRNALACLGDERPRCLVTHQRRQFFFPLRETPMSWNNRPGRIFPLPQCAPFGPGTKNGSDFTDVVMLTLCSKDPPTHASPVPTEILWKYAVAGKRYLFYPFFPRFETMSEDADCPRM